MTDAARESSPPSGGGRPSARQAWLRAPSMPPGAALRLTTVINAGGLTPEVFDLLRELMVENDTREKDGPDSAAGACPHLTHCETRQGLCPVLVGCGTYTAVADVEVQAKD